MNFSPGLSRLFQTNRFDWRHPNTRDAVILLGTAALAYLSAHTFELAPKLFQFGVDYADWEVDDLIFVLFVLSIAMMVNLFRRYQDLSHEIEARIGAEGEAHSLARHDPLTGLPNRRFFNEKLEEYLSAASATHQVAI